MAFLEVHNLAVYYDGIVAVNNVSFSVNEHEVVVLIGANGAGKSSILRALLGLVPCTCDRLSVQDKDISHARTRDRLERGLALVPETRELFPAMSVEDNLKLGLLLRKGEKSFSNELELVSELFPILKDRLSQRAGTLSGGQQQMLAVARALMQKPRLLCLDEPSLGLAPKLVTELYQTLARIRTEGTGILLVEQQARRALQFGARGYVLNVGEIVRKGSCKELAEDEFVHTAYLGMSS